MCCRSNDQEKRFPTEEEEHRMFETIPEIHQMYRDKRITVREAVFAYLTRIAEIDKRADGLRSVLEINSDALFIADSMDRQLREGGDMPPLFGIPVLLKDNINTADRLHTSAGSVALADNYAPYDAHIVKQLRQAGALILGKANMTEFANYMTRDGMPSGYSSRGGQVLNPFNREKTPSGSSSGSAVAVAAGLCTVSIGTETSGSIVYPAANNGIVGIKPTLGLVGRSGIVPICGTHDTAGPMARSVWDAALLLGVMAGADPDDAATRACPHNGFTDYTKHLGENRLDGVRIGINRAEAEDDDLRLSEEEKGAFERVCGLLAGAGAVLADNVNIGPQRGIGNIMRHEFKACMNYYLHTLGECTKMKTLKDIVEYNQGHAPVALKYGQSLLTNTENDTSGTMTEPEYIEALMEREKTIAALDGLFNDHGIDVMLCESFTNIAPYTGFPCMTIPIGQGQDNMPFGSYWVARRFDEASLLRVTYAVERGLGLSLRP